MFSLSKNGIITIDAGDSAIFTLNINAGEILNPLTYDLTDYDKLCMSVMQPNQAFQRGILRKVFYKKDIDAQGNVLISLSQKTHKTYFQAGTIINLNYCRYEITRHISIR